MFSPECSANAHLSSVSAAPDVQLKSVLVPFDFSEASRKPLRHALAIARHYGASFHLAYVVTPAVGFLIAGQSSLTLAGESAQRDMQQLKKELLESGALTDLQHEFHLAEGNVWEQLERLVRENSIDAVVIGTHGRGALGKLLLGSVAEQVFRSANCLVLTVGPGSYQDAIVDGHRSVGPFLFATDFGPASLRALPYAASFAQHFGARLILLHVLPAAPIPEGFHWSTAGDVMKMRESARVYAHKQLEEIASQYVPTALKPEYMAKFGIASEQILLASHALKSDLILMGLNRPADIGTASHTPWAVAYKVVCGARCPVLTVRNQTEPKEV